MTSAAKKNRKTISVKEGHLTVASDGEILEAVAGQGVCVCIWNQKLHTGGLCHFLEAEAPSADSANDTRYGDTALFKLMKQMIKFGQADECCAAIIGGAPLPDRDTAEANLAMAHDYLDLQNIPIVLNEERGSRLRRVRFDTYQGGVQIKTL